MDEWIERWMKCLMIVRSVGSNLTCLLTFLKYKANFIPKKMQVRVLTPPNFKENKQIRHCDWPNIKIDQKYKIHLQILGV